jgi:hypothetical protein
MGAFKEADAFRASRCAAVGTFRSKVGMSEYERTQEAFHANRERLKAERLVREAEAAFADRPTGRRNDLDGVT